MKPAKLLLGALILTSAAALGVAGFSLAWLSGATTEVNVESAKGGIVYQYFDSGKGTEDEPFIITRPVHLYNLTQLHEKLDGFDTANYHFQVGKDINNNGELEVYTYDDNGVYQETTGKVLNANYYDLLPIGSESHPFVGNFDGSGITIDNIHIEESGASDLGFFGYVTEDAEISNLYIDNIDINVDDADAGHSHSTAYAGFIAGHIEDATKFSNVYVNNATITGDGNITNDWGYFGHCYNAASLEQFIATAQGEGDLNSWGGSVHAKDYTALGYTLNPRDSGTYTKTVSGNGGYYMAITSSSRNNPVNNQVVYRLRDGSYIPLKFGNDDRAHNKNTGYLVGSNVGTGVNASPKISSYKLVNIGNALSNTAYTNMATTYGSSTPNISYDDSKLEVLTYYNGGWKRISDEHNINNNTTNTEIRNYTKTNYADMNLVKYQASRNSLQTILDGSNFIHGIHFDNNQVSASNLLTIPANTARVDEVNYTTTYQVPKGSINFKLREKGFINFFAGTYNSSHVNLNFFSLHQVNRNGGSISSIKEITQIYENTASGNPYVYKYSDNSYSAGTRGNLVFDIATILKGNAPVCNMLYYFELPVNPGEYAMGVAGSTQGAYMIYLDLGAHAGEGEEGVDDFKSVEYRSRPDTADHSIVLLRYQRDAATTVTIYYEQEKYYITANCPIIVVLLSNDYEVYLNNSLILTQIGEYNGT